MQEEENSFAEVVKKICERDPRFQSGAYYFLRQALDYTVRQASSKKKPTTERGHHVSGAQLLEGIREFALSQFGPLTLTVLHHWGVEKCADFGEIVFNLVESGVLGKTEDDKRSDFTELYSFHDAFEKPFKPH